ncbi:hypothetical protein N0V88_005994 [Collariella sp. IMI 366227]|nr:hypothetical protein N0V88_005994 [Collariella sp. IMI 366227]
MRGMYAPFFRRLTLPTSTNADTEVSAIAFDNFARNPNHRIDDYLWEFYNALFIVIGQTEPKLQTGIIDLLLCLRKKSVPRTDDWPSSVKGEVWKDLPTFGWVARDFFNYNTHDDLPKDAQERIINLNAFLAQLTNMTTSKTNLVPESNDDDNPEDPFDFSLFGLWAMRDGLEATPPLGCFPVKLAEVWVQYASDRMKQLCVERKEFPGKQGEPGPWWEEKGWTGFNMQRKVEG